MSANPARHSQDDREHLVGQWPAPPRRDLPEDRHAVYREFLMHEIDAQSTPAATPQARPRRWLAWRVAASTAVLGAGALVAAIVVPAVTGHSGATGTHTATAGTKPAGPTVLADIETVAYSIKVLPGGYVMVTLHTHGNKLDIKRFEDDMAKVGVQARVLDCGGTTLGVSEIGLKPEEGPLVLELRPGFMLLHARADLTATWTCGQS